MGDQIRSVRVRLSAEHASYMASMRAAGLETKQTAREMDNAGNSARRLDSDLDRVSGRAKILAQALAVLGPAAIPISALASPAVSGLTNQLGFAAIGAGTAVVAFQGVGDAVKAMGKADLEPTIDNLNAAKLALDRLSPSAAGFVKTLASLRPAGQALVDTAADGLFPGMTEGLESLATRGPQAQSILKGISTELGDIAAETGESLASARWTPFLDFVGEQGPRNLDVLAESIGNVTHGLAGLWMGTQPLNNDFNSWLLDSTKRFDEWGNSLDDNQGYQDLISYIRDTGPQAGATLGAIGNSLVQIVQAAAPLGGPVLASIEAVANAIGAVADSDLGTPIFTGIAALALLNRGLTLTATLQGRTFGGPAIGQLRGFGRQIRGVSDEVKAAQAILTRAQAAQSVALARARDAQFALIPQADKRQALSDYVAASDRTREAEDLLSDAVENRGQTVRRNLGSFVKGAALAGGIALASTGAADSIGLSNTASLAMAGTIAGPWGTALGAGVGAVMDLKNANGDLQKAIDQVNDALSKGDTKTFNDGIDKLTGKLKDIDKTSGVGDAFDDFKNWASYIAGHPLDYFNPDAQRNAIRDQIVWSKGLMAARKQVEASTEAARRAATAQQFLADGFQLTKGGADSAAMSIEEFTNSMTKANNILERRSNLRSYASALLDFADAFKKNGATTDLNTRAGIENLEKLDNIANTAIKTAESMSRPRGERFLDSVRDQYIKARMALGNTRKEAERFADRLGLINRMNVAPDIDVNLDPARAKVEDFVRQLQGYHINIPVTASTNANLGELAAVTKGSRNTDGTRDRDGNPATGKGKADGGSIWGPGSKTSDSIPIMASNGEFMQPADSVDYYGLNFMEAIRRRQLPRYANGGPIGEFPTLNLGGPSTATTAANAAAEAAKNKGILKGLNKELKELEKALEKSTDAIDKERGKRDDLIATRNDLADTITGGVRQDLFADRPDNFEWMTAADQQRFLTQNPVDIANSNTTRGDALTKALQTLAAKGLDGSPYEQLAATGDLERIQAFAGLSKTQLATFETAVKRGDAATARAGRYGAGVVYNAQIDTTNAHLVVMVKEAKGIREDLHDVKVEIKKVSSKGKASKSATGASVRTRKKGP